MPDRNNTPSLAPSFLAATDFAEIVPDPYGVGRFLRLTASEASSRLLFPIGRIDGLRRFTACHRYEPYWMKASAGIREQDVPLETQSLLAEREGDYAILIPILDRAFRCSLQGSEQNGLELVAESGDESVTATSIVGLFFASGSDPYKLIESAAAAVMARMQTGRLRKDKPLPAFVEQFGWCTWNAFYQDVSQDKVAAGLESFRAGGVEPRLLILDDGWQSTAEKPTKEQVLTSFAPNEKFNGTLKPLTSMAKDEYGIETFLVWHAIHGYWGGVDSELCEEYETRSAPRKFSPGIRALGTGPEEWWGPTVSAVAKKDIYRFYHDYHRLLRVQGVDGVKVDSQSTVEGVAAGDGGRVTVMRRYHEALEGSVQTQFRGNLINCMSCSSDMLYSALNSTVTRTSTDFWPDLPESHGAHLYINAQVGAWFGEFVHPDWDMFQSAHPMGAFHAAGRAVSGSPVYVSDKTDGHDFDLLRKLVLRDGTILRCLDPGRPTRDCLFHDPTQEDVLLKVFNRNAHSGIVGAFHCRYSADENASAPIAGTVSPSDVHGIAGDEFAVYAHYAAELRVLRATDSWSFALKPLTAEMFTIVPIENGFAPIGLIDLYNSGGAIVSSRSDTSGDIVDLRAGGRFAAWRKTRPTSVVCNGDEVGFEFDADANRLDIAVACEGPCRLRIR